MMTYSVCGSVGEYGITAADGQKVYDAIHPELKGGRPVVMDFGGVAVVASPFLNAAIGSLLEDVPVEDLNRLLDIRNLSPVGSSVLRRVVENSKQYYHNADTRRAVDDMLTEFAEAV